MSPSKPSVTPITRQAYFWMAHFVAARITAFKPGQSPPPVEMPIVLISAIVMCEERSIVTRRKRERNLETKGGASCLLGCDDRARTRASGDAPDRVQRIAGGDGEDRNIVIGGIRHEYEAARGIDGNVGRRLPGGEWRAAYGGQGAIDIHSPGRKVVAAGVRRKNVFSRSAAGNG